MRKYDGGELEAWLPFTVITQYERLLAVRILGRLAVSENYKVIRDLFLLFPLTQISGRRPEDVLVHMSRELSAPRANTVSASCMDIDSQSFTDTIAIWGSFGAVHMCLRCLHLAKALAAFLSHVVGADPKHSRALTRTYISLGNRCADTLPTSSETFPYLFPRIPHNFSIHNVIYRREFSRIPTFPIPRPPSGIAEYGLQGLAQIRSPCRACKIRLRCQNSRSTIARYLGYTPKPPSCNLSNMQTDSCRGKYTHTRDYEPVRTQPADTVDVRAFPGHHGPVHLSKSRLKSSMERHSHGRHPTRTSTSNHAILPEPIPPRDKSRHPGSNNPYLQSQSRGLHKASGIHILARVAGNARPHCVQRMASAIAHFSPASSAIYRDYEYLYGGPIEVSLALVV
jgi:hypothetical protein